MSRRGRCRKRFHYGQQEFVSPATALAAELGVTGPAYVHSSACASSAKALASAARLIRMNACDAVVAGGVDTLCRFTVAGFAALESLSTRRCNPLSRNRNGINIGEGAALFLVSREPATVSLRGWGESSDGYHMSAPDPAGVGARLALEQALARAPVTAAEIEYVNLHGTATVQNDAMEAELIHRVFGDRAACEFDQTLYRPCAWRGRGDRSGTLLAGDAGRQSDRQAAGPFMGWDRRSEFAGITVGHVGYQTGPSAALGGEQLIRFRRC